MSAEELDAVAPDLFLGRGVDTPVRVRARVVPDDVLEVLLEVPRELELALGARLLGVDQGVPRSEILALHHDRLLVVVEHHLLRLRITLVLPAVHLHLVEGGEVVAFSEERRDQLLGGQEKPLREPERRAESAVEHVRVELLHLRVVDRPGVDALGVPFLLGEPGDAVAFSPDVDEDDVHFPVEDEAPLEELLLLFLGEVFDPRERGAPRADAPAVPGLLDFLVLPRLLKHYGVLAVERTHRAFASADRERYRVPDAVLDAVVREGRDLELLLVRLGLAEDEDQDVAEVALDPFVIDRPELVALGFPRVVHALRAHEVVLRGREVPVFGGVPLGHSDLREVIRLFVVLERFFERAVLRGFEAAQNALALDHDLADERRVVAAEVRDPVLQRDFPVGELLARLGPGMVSGRVLQQAPRRPNFRALLLFGHFRVLLSILLLFHGLVEP